MNTEDRHVQLHTASSRCLQPAEHPPPPASKYNAYTCLYHIPTLTYHTIACPQGFISQASLEKAAAVRKQGAAFVIVSGARTSTVLQRLPYLPAADAIIAENGEMRCLESFNPNLGLRQPANCLLCLLGLPFPHSFRIQLTPSSHTGSESLYNPEKCHCHQAHLAGTAC